MESSACALSPRIDGKDVGDTVHEIEGRSIGECVSEKLAEQIASTSAARRALVLAELSREPMTHAAPATSDPFPMTREEAESLVAAWRIAKATCMPTRLESRAPVPGVAILAVPTFGGCEWSGHLFTMGASPEDMKRRLDPGESEAIDVFTSAVADADPEHALILDLRGNAFGEAKVAARCAEALVTGRFVFSRARRVVSTHDGKREQTIAEHVTGLEIKHALFKKRLVLVVDETTAGAAEIFVAALRDLRKDTVVVGRATAGRPRETASNGLQRAARPCAFRSRRSCARTEA
jgi:hypothetical protein